MSGNSELPIAGTSGPSSEAAGTSAAAATGPKGIGGWLILPLLQLLLAGPALLLMLAVDLSEVLTGEATSVGWRDLARLLTLSRSDLLVTLGQPEILLGLTIVTLLVSYYVSLLALDIWCLVLFFRKSRRVPKAMTIFYLVFAGYNIVFFLLLYMTDQLSGPEMVAYRRGLVRSIISAAIWIPYFQNSVRVRNTFVR